MPIPVVWYWKLGVQVFWFSRKVGTNLRTSNLEISLLGPPFWKGGGGLYKGSLCRVLVQESLNFEIAS